MSPHEQTPPARDGLMDSLEERVPELPSPRKAGINKRALAFVGAMLALVLMMLAALFRSAPESSRRESSQRVAAPSKVNLPSDAQIRASGGSANGGDGPGGSRGADRSAGPGMAGGGLAADAASGDAAKRPRYRVDMDDDGRAAGVGGAAGQVGILDDEAAALYSALQDADAGIPLIRNGAGNGRGAAAGHAGNAGRGGVAGGYGRAGGQGANGAGGAFGMGGAAGGMGLSARAGGGTRGAGNGGRAGQAREIAAERREALLQQRLPAPLSPAEQQALAEQEAQQRLADRLMKLATPATGRETAREDTRLPGQRAADGPSSAQFLSEPDLLLARGTYIRCVLETRIITDLEGFASCVTAEPVYSVNGRRLLIPRGSKVLGSYAGGVVSGNRLAVVWDRVMTPSGIDITMESPGVDTLGGAGHPGQYDAHWAERTSAAFFISLFSDAFKYYGEKYGPKTVNDNGLGGVSVQPFESNTAATMERVANEAVQAGLSRPPTVTLNQGTVVSIYVAKDVDFSGVLPPRSGE